MAAILILLFFASFIPSINVTLAGTNIPTLASTIKNLVANINFTSDIDTAYMGLNFGQATMQTVQNMIDSLPSSDWTSIIYWYAVLDKYNVANQTTIERALDSATVMANGLPGETTDLNGQLCFFLHDRYLLYGYYWADKYQYDLTKWNMTHAYNSYDTAVKCSQTNSGVPPLWIYADNSAKPYSGRYYDETGESLDGYLEFYKFGVTQALPQAENLWNFANNYYWNGAYYGYTGANGLYECEAGGFEQIIWKLYDYNTSLPNTQNLLTDINTRYLNNLWNSPQWLYNVIQHANSNPQRRLENTEMAWQSIIGTYSDLSPSAQTEVQDLLNGTAYGISNSNNEAQPAWTLLSNQLAGLYDSSTGLYRIRSDAAPSDSATALAANLLIYMGIIQTTAQLAVPLEEISYEYTYNIIDKDLYAMDFNTNSIKIPILSSGDLTFTYGTTPVTCNFNQEGIWNVTFSSDWNTISSATFIAELPTNRLYLDPNQNTENPPPSYPSTEVGFPLSITVPVQEGTNSIQIYVNSSLEYNNTIFINDNTTSVNCQIETVGIPIGNYTITADVNNNSSFIETVRITYLGDLNGDFKIDSNDFLIFMADYVNFNSVSGRQYNARSDFNQDEKIDAADFFTFMSAYIFYNSMKQ